MFKSIKFNFSNKTLLIILSIVVVIVLYYFNVFSCSIEGFNGRQTCGSDEYNLIDHHLFTDNDGVKYFQSWTPLPGNCYWQGNDSTKIYKSCPLSCSSESDTSGLHVTCKKNIDNCSGKAGAFLDPSSNNWVIRVRDSIGQNVTTGLNSSSSIVKKMNLLKDCFSTKNTCYSSCNSTGNVDGNCRDVCDDSFNSCAVSNGIPGYQAQSVMPAFNPGIYFNDGTMQGQNGYNINHMASQLEQPGNSYNNNQFYNPSFGNFAPDHSYQRNNLQMSQQSLNAPFNVFKGFLKNLVKEVHEESTVGIGRLPNTDNPFLCDFKNPACSANNHNLENNPAYQNVRGITTCTTPFY